jgi:hypothetical protein
MAEHKKLVVVVKVVKEQFKSKGVQLKSDYIKNLDEQVRNWITNDINNMLLEKHKETFWVEATSTYIDGLEHFQYSIVEHTKKPITSQFDILVDQGIITLDHLIKRNSNGKVVEKGPIFKIKPKGLDLLFPPSEKYNLI